MMTFRSMKNRRQRWSILAIVLALALSGCFHRQSPQQKFFTSLARGEGAQATQTWLNMSPSDRLKLARGQGLQPQVSQSQVEAQVRQHLEQESADGDGSTSAETP